MVDAAVASRNDNGQSHRGLGKLGALSREGMAESPEGSPVEAPPAPNSLDRSTVSVWPAEAR